MNDENGYPLVMMCIAARDLIQLGKYATSETATEQDKELFRKQCERTERLIEKCIGVTV